MDPALSHKSEDPKYVFMRAKDTSFETFTAVILKSRSSGFWPCSVVVGYQRFGGRCCIHLQGEDGGNMGLWHVGISPQHYTASEPRRPRLTV